MRCPATCPGQVRRLAAVRCCSWHVQGMATWLGTGRVAARVSGWGESWLWLATYSGSGVWQQVAWIGCRPGHHSSGPEHAAPTMTPLEVAALTSCLFKPVRGGRCQCWAPTLPVLSGSTWAEGRRLALLSASRLPPAGRLPHLPPCLPPAG